MKNYQKIIACVLAVAVSGGATGLYAYSQRRDAAAHTTDVSVQALPAVTVPENTERRPEAGETFKDETVYVLCNNDTSIRDVIVSDWLKNPGALSSLADCSSLSHIENVKGDETFTGSGTSMNWNAAGNDIYYKGESDAELPVTVHMTYTLDGRKVDPDAIKGKSGHLVIEWSYENQTAETRMVAGRSQKVYVPFLTASTAVLDTNIFRNVNVTNGRVISDGEKLIVVGMAFPGLSESLGLDDSDALDITIPEHFTLEADVTNFSMASSVTVVSNELFSELDLDKTDSLKDLEKKLDELNDAAEQLCDGTQQLYDGMSELSAGTGDLADGAKQLADGGISLKDGAVRLGDGAQKLSDGCKTVADSTAQLA